MLARLTTNDHHHGDTTITNLARRYESLGFWKEANLARLGKETSHMRWIRRTWGF